MEHANLFVIIVSALLVNNVVLARILGICPFIGVSKQVETATGMGMAVTFVITMAGTITWVVYYYLLVPLNMEYLQTGAFILVIAALVQFVEFVLQKTSPTLYQALGVYLPLITTNCAVLGLALLNIQYKYGFIASLVNSVATPLGFMLAIVLFAGIRERLELSDIPKPFVGFPIALITASLMAIAFLGFSGLV